MLQGQQRPETVAVGQTQMASRNDHCRSPATYQNELPGRAGNGGEREEVGHPRTSAALFENAGLIIAARMVLVQGRQKLLVDADAQTWWQLCRSVES